VYRGDLYDTVFALNTDLERPLPATVEAPKGVSLKVQLDPGAMRLVYVFRDMALCFDSPMTALAGAKRSRAWELRVHGDEPLGARLAFAQGLAPKSVSLGDDCVTEYGFTYPYYSFHFAETGGVLRVATRKHK